MSRWVQHISGQGREWERVTEKCVIGFNYGAGQAYLKLTATDAVSAWLPPGYRFEMLYKDELADGEMCLVIEKVD